MRTSDQSTRQGSPPSRSALSAPASRRLPVPPRERKPALAALALLLILGGALATTLLVLRSGDRVSAIRISQKVGAGQSIPLPAMEEVQIADTGIGFVHWRERQAVAQYYAAVDLIPGTLLTSQMVSTSTEIGPGKAIVGLSLKAGQMPADLAAGDRVQVIYVPGAAKAGNASKILAQNALVQRVFRSQRAGANAAIQISVVVDVNVSPLIASYSSLGEVAVARLPAGSGPAPATTQPPADESPPTQTPRPTRSPGG